MRADRFADVRAAALRVLAEHGMTRPEDIDLDVIAAAMRATITYDDLDGASGRVMRIGPHARIRISNRIQDPGARRFIGGHELGHLHLGHEVPNADSGELVERICTPLTTDRRITERSASVFSSELVMPEPMVRPRCEVPHVTLAPAHVIAGEFRTSLLASAMRFVELSNERCAVAYSVLGCVRWLKPSATFPDWIPRGRRLDPATIAFDYHQRGAIDLEPNVVPADAWLPRDRIDTSSTSIVEHSAIVPELGAVFSMLWLPENESMHLDLGSEVRI